MCHVHCTVLSLWPSSTLHTLLYCAQLLILSLVSASRFFIPDFPLVVSTPFLSVAPLHGITFPFLSDRNPLWTLLNLASRHFFFQNNRSAMFFALCCRLAPPQAQVPICYLYKSSCVWSVCACVYLHAYSMYSCIHVLRIVSGQNSSTIHTQWLRIRCSLWFHCQGHSFLSVLQIQANSNTDLLLLWSACPGCSSVKLH